MRHNLLRKSACRNHGGLPFQLILQSVNNSIDRSGTAVDNSTLHAFYRILSYDMLRCFNPNPSKLGCTSRQ